MNKKNRFRGYITSDMLKTAMGKDYKCSSGLEIELDTDITIYEDITDLKDDSYRYGDYSSTVFVIDLSCQASKNFGYKKKTTNHILIVYDSVDVNGIPSYLSDRIY